LDAKEIRELIEVISRSNFATFELERKDFKLKLVKAEPPAAAPRPAVPPPAEPVATTAIEAVVESPPPAAAAQPASATNGLIEITSPIIGTFYRSPSPDAAPFVEVGAKVQKGQVLCIVEAMKLMNEIESEIEGELIEAPVANGQPVEYGEVLFRVRPA
jgi:acetyl-CoA carboxylase biotin carboxyl carrier protein